MRYHVQVAGRSLDVELSADGVRVDGVPVSAELASIAGGPVHSLLLDGASHRLVAHAAERGRWDLQLRGRRLSVEVVDERTRAIREMTGAGGPVAGPRRVRAPMPGLIVRIEVAVGDRVTPGQGLVIVEAMKMENELRAESAGVVSAVHVAAGEAVAKDQVLIDMAPEETG